MCSRYVCVGRLHVFFAIISRSPWPPFAFVCVQYVFISGVREVLMNVDALKYSPMVKVFKLCFCVCGSVLSAQQTGCIGLHADRFVIPSNHLGQALTPFYLVMTLGQSQYS